MSRISVFGLGYVGAVTAAVLAEDGHTVIGVDANPSKVAAVAGGRAPVVELGLDDLILRGVRSGQLRATADVDEAVSGSDISMICVGTPSLESGGLDLSQVEKVCGEIGHRLRDKAAPHTVVVRSTLLPGSTDQVVIPALEGTSGRIVGQGVLVGVNPEFLREGSSLKDFYDPPFTIVGADDDQTARSIAELYEGAPSPPLVVPVRVAEMLKYACNAFHALKIVFANEIDSICLRQGIDSTQMMEIFCRDTKLNVSPRYLRPGFAFGGSCLPKDLRALVHHARHLDVDTPVLGAILRSNRDHVSRALQEVMATGERRIGLVGLSFKPGTDDLRESPLVELAERLIGKGYDLRVHDPHVAVANLVGANRRYIEREIPHIATLMVDTPAELLRDSEVIVLGHDSPDARAVTRQLSAHHRVIDLVRSGAHAQVPVG